MKRKYGIVFIMAIILSFSYFDSVYSQTRESGSLFKDIVKETNSSITEYGVKARYVTQRGGEEACVAIFNKLDLENCKSVKEVKNNYQYCIEFSDEHKSGYIQSAQNKDYNIITINIIEKKSTDGLKVLRNNIDCAMDRNDKKIKCYQYLKAKTPDNNISNVNEKIIDILKVQRSQDISTVRISNGYSTIANTRCYEPIKVDGKDVDFNYAICNYTSGNYIILGTPEIITSY